MKKKKQIDARDSKAGVSGSESVEGVIKKNKKIKKDKSSQHLLSTS